MSWIADPFTPVFMQRALVELAVLSVAAGALGAFVVLRRLADPTTCAIMLAKAKLDLAAGVPPVEYEADTGYPGAPASREAPGGRTVRRLLQAYARSAVLAQWLKIGRAHV